MDVYTRIFVYGVVVPFVLSVGALASIVLPRGGEDLTYTRLFSGLGVMAFIMIFGGLLGGQLAIRKGNK